MLSVPEVTNLKAKSNKEGQIKITFDRPEGKGPFKYAFAVQNTETGEFKYKRVYEKEKCVFKKLDPGCPYEVKVQTRMRNPNALRGVLSNKNTLRSEWVSYDEIVVILGEEKDKEFVDTKIHLLITKGDKIPPYAIGEPFYVRMNNKGKFVRWDNPTKDKIEEYVEDRIGYYEEAHEELLETIEEMEGDVKEERLEGNDEEANRLEFIVKMMKEGIPRSLNVVLESRERLEREAQELYKNKFPIPIPNPEKTLGCGVLVPVELHEVK